MASENVGHIKTPVGSVDYDEAVKEKVLDSYAKSGVEIDAAEIDRVALLVNQRPGKEGWKWIDEREWHEAAVRISNRDLAESNADMMQRQDVANDPALPIATTSNVQSDDANYAVIFADALKMPVKYRSATDKELIGNLKRYQKIISSSRAFHGLSASGRREVAYLKTYLECRAWQLRAGDALKDCRIEVKVPFEQITDGCDMPITGKGLVNVKVAFKPPENASAGEKLGHLFHRVAKSSFLLSVHDGGAEIVDQWSRAPQKVLQRVYRQAEPIVRFIKDALRSKGVRKGATILGAGAGVTSFALSVTGLLSGLGIAGAGALVIWAGKEIMAGLSRRTEARTKALAKTVDWSEKALKKNGEYPHFQAAYNYYQQALRLTATEEVTGGSPYPGSPRWFHTQLRKVVWPV